MIFGVATLGACMFVGELLGGILGQILGIHSNIGGVGFAMLLLLVITNSKWASRITTPKFEQGINFWQSMYTPVVIAMAASQNVAQALSRGMIAIAGGLVAVVFAFLLLPLINRIPERQRSDEVETT